MQPRPSSSDGQCLAASFGGTTHLSHDESATPSSSQTGPATCAVPVAPTVLFADVYTSTSAGPPSSTLLPIGKRHPPLSIAGFLLFLGQLLLPLTTVASVSVSESSYFLPCSKIFNRQ
ncbi:hypothetical protein GW17_00029510 [Ensete ventricosum]|nr:hypothetical protein GW17_00029510 [Ensete ventricosum]